MRLNHILQSIIEHSEKHKLPNMLSLPKLINLCTADCSYCESKITGPRTYQNIGLKKRNNGFMDTNVFALCTLCYRSRYGMTRDQYVKKARKIMEHSIQRRCKWFEKGSCERTKICFPKKSNCNLCGKYSETTLDRIDSKKCYSYANIQYSCYECNRMKSNITQRTFMKHMSKVSSM